MNIIDMPFLAWRPFPTNEVENSRFEAEEIREKFRSEEADGEKETRERERKT